MNFDTALNFLFRKGRIQSRPRFNVLTSPPDGRPIRVMYTFEDFNGNWHTLVLTDTTPYFITFPGGVATYNALTMPSGLTNLGGVLGSPFSIRELNQQVFFANAYNPLLYVDGSINVQVAGDVPGSCAYLTENASYLIGLSWIEPSTGITSSYPFPFRVRWSDAGNPLVWTPDPSNSAGANDLVTTGGILTGAATIGTRTYIMRRNGATVMTPTGVATQPFDFEPFMWSQPGWGNFFPYSLVTWTYATICVTSEGEVVMFDGSNFTRLAGGKTKKAISADLALVANDQVVGYAIDSFGPGFDFEGYALSIPGPNITWIHNLEEGTWTRINSSKGWLTCVAKVAVS